MKTVTFLTVDTIVNWPTDDAIYFRRYGWFPRLDRVFVPDLVMATEQYVKEHHQLEYKMAKFEDIDKSKPWFVFLYTNFQYRLHYQTLSSYTDKQLFKGIPEEVIYELKYGNAYLLMSCENESYTNNYFDLFYALYKHNPAVPFNKIIYLTAASNIQEIYDRYCTEHNIEESNKTQVWYSHHGWLDLIKFSLNNFRKYDLPKDRKFLSLNRVARSHRVAMVCMLAELGLLDHGHVSLGLRDNTWPSIDGLLEYVTTHMFSWYSWSKLNEPWKTAIAGIPKLKEKLPLYVDNPDLEFNHVGYDAAPYEYYSKTYFSIVCGTWALKKDEEGITVNDKEFKTILGRHPFLLVSRPGALELLKRIGFKTFSQWFDESYDQEEDDGYRLLKIAKETERLCKLSNEEWDLMIKEMEPTLEHNFNWLATHYQEMSFNYTDLQQLLKYAV